MSKKRTGIRHPGTSAFHSNKKRRRKVIERDGHQCVWCGNADDGTDKNRLSVDHIRPLSQGGTNNPWNLQTLCHFCNQMKGDQYPFSPPSREEIHEMQAEMNGVFRKIEWG